MDSFVVGQQVMHFREGLSVISDTKEMEGNLYFMVQPLHEGGEMIYVPVDRASAVLRHIIDKKDVKPLVKRMKETKPEYFTNTKQRRDVFKRRLGSGDINDLAYLTMLLHFYYHPEEIDTPVKFGPADIDMLKYATRTLYDELAIALKIPREKVEEKIFGMMKGL